MSEEAAATIEAPAETQATEAPASGGGAPSSTDVGQAAAEAIADGASIDLDATIRVKVDGQEREVKVRDAIRDYELRSASHKRMEEAARARKEAERHLGSVREMVELLKDPAGLISVAQEMGVDTRALEKHLRAELDMPEDAKRMREIERRERALQQREDAERKQREEAKAQQATERARQRYLTDISTGIETAGLPKTPGMVAAVARTLLSAQDRGVEMTIGDAVEMVQGELRGFVEHVTRDAPVDAVRKLLGEDKIRALREADVSAATAHRDATRPRPAGGPPKGPPVQRKRIPSWQLTPEQYSALLDGKEID